MSKVIELVKFLLSLIKFGTKNDTLAVFVKFAKPKNFLASITEDSAKTNSKMKTENSLENQIHDSI